MRIDQSRREIRVSEKRKIGGRE